MGDVIVPSLMPGDCTDVICVRASRFWEFYDIHDETKLLHADLVFIDEEGNSVHAQIYDKNAYAKFKGVIKEGRVYNLSCFWIKKSNDNYKPVTNDIMFSLSTWTLMDEIVEIPPGFPCITYSLTPIEQVPSRVNYTEYFTDVIGIVTSVSNEMSIRARGRQSESSKRVVTLRSASNASLDVILWGERASSFPAEQIQTYGQISPQVVIFVGTLVKKNYLGDITLTGNAPCRWYVNPEVPEARALLSSLGDTNQPIKWNQQMPLNAPAPAIEEKKVSEIINLNPFKNKKSEFLVTVTIKKIDSSWWYNACYKCSRTAKPYGNQFRCCEPTCDYIGKPTQSTDSSLQRTPQKSAAFPSPSKSTTTQTTYASSETPTKTLLSISEPQLTPQSRKYQHDNQDKTLASTANVPGDSSTETEKSNTKKRSFPSPDKKVAKKLFTGKEAGDDDDQSDGGAAAVDHTRTSPTKDA